ncbi:MAG: hypothetical protein AMXMBFR84_03220 [Candidatus Hydrogenedentota bacterium]
MKDFVPWLIGPYASQRKFRQFCEIGARTGATSARLLELDGATLSIIDPCEDDDLITRFEGDSRVKVIKGFSLDVLPVLTDTFDAFLIDGDHNWYTVYHELAVIHDRSLLKPGGVIFLHDTAWPYGRRDMYFDPGRIPKEYVQPHERRGIVRGQPDLADSGVNAHHYNALHEGGPRNGVLTAVEDFAREHKGGYIRYSLDVQFGITMLHRCGRPEEDWMFERFTRSISRRIRIGAWKQRMDRIVPGAVPLYRAVRRLFRRNSP